MTTLLVKFICHIKDVSSDKEAMHEIMILGLIQVNAVGMSSLQDHEGKLQWLFVRKMLRWVCVCEPA